MDIVQSEWAPWTLPTVLSRLSTESMDIVQGAHEFSGHFTDRQDGFSIQRFVCQSHVRFLYYLIRILGDTTQFGYLVI